MLLEMFTLAGGIGLNGSITIDRAPASVAVTRW
jgi:hypothetical protein